MRKILLLIGVFAALMGQCAPAQAAGLTIAVQGVEFVPVTTPAAGTHDFIFVRVRVDYGGSDILHFSPSSLALLDPNGQLHIPLPYAGPNPLSSTDLAGTAAHQEGYILFRLSPSQTKNLSLDYLQTVQTTDGMSHTVSLASVPMVLPSSPDPLRVYATAAQSTLQTYLIDEALAAGYMGSTMTAQLGADPPMPAQTSDFLRHQHAAVVRDRVAFDTIPAGGKASSYKQRADAIMTRLDGDLANALKLRATTQWTEWSTKFTRDDRALAGLYQGWPSVPLSAV